MAWAALAGWCCAALGAAERQADEPRHGIRLDVVHLNEIKGGAAACAHLLEFDSVQGRWRGPRIEAAGTGAVQVGARQLSFSTHAAPQDIQWGDLGVDVVMECTGKLLSPAVLAGHLSRGAQRRSEEHTSNSSHRCTSRMPSSA